MGIAPEKLFFVAGTSMNTLKNKSVVITGAASGIGRALALECARRGARLLLADINAPGLQQAVDAAKAIGALCDGLPTDTGDEAAIFALAAEAARLFGAADVVVNNAGVTLVAPVATLPTADAHWLMNINFWGVVHGCQAFTPQLRARPGSAIVNLSSVFAMVSMPTQGYYNASKAAVRALSDALREELRDSGVQVLCVHPGGVRTAIARQARLGDISSVADSATALHAQFDAVARTSPDRAAAVILDALAAGRQRVLIGPDARLGDWLFRLAPTRASQWFSALARWQRDRLARSAAAKDR